MSSDVLGLWVSVVALGSGGAELAFVVCAGVGIRWKDGSRVNAHP